jgi:purine-binding chemotaxis protein CheW
MATLPYLVYRLRGALYGTEATLVREVFPLPEVTPLAAAPRSVVGVLNFRGSVITVVDLAVRLGYAARGPRLTDTVIVLEREGRQLGLVVEEVLEVREIGFEQTEPAPAVASPFSGAPPAAGRVAKAGSEIITLVDVDEILAFDGEQVLHEPLDASPEEASEPAAGTELAELRERARRIATAPEDRELRNLVSLAVISLNEEWFGVDLATVREFSEARQVTPVPCCPEHVVGAVNLRGEILTLVDVRQALQMPVPPERPASKLMVVQVGQLRAGVMVDAVLDVVHLDEADAAPVPYSVRSPIEEHISGTAPYAGKMLAILDLSGIFSREDWIVNVEA